MKICAAQTEPVKGDIQANIKQHLDLIDLALKKEAELIIFPELSISGYEPTLAQELATRSEDIRFDVFQRKSDQNNIVISIGAPIINGDKVSIGMTIFRPNEARKSYLKKYLYHTEEDSFIRGESFTNLMVKDSNIGLAICYEISVPEHQKVAFENGAEIYVAGVVESVERIDPAIEKMAKTASKYSTPVLMANCVGISGGYNCAGKSSIWNVKGELMGQLNTTESGVLIYDTLSNKLI